MAVPFYRMPIDPVWAVCMLKFKKKYKTEKLINYRNLRLKFIVNKYPKRWRLPLKFYILRKWHEKNVQYTNGYILKLKAKIKKMGLSPHLLPAERDYLTRLEEITFARFRALKKLDVPLKLDEDEACYFRFLKGQLLLRQKGMVRKIDTGALYITDRHIILVGVKEVYKIDIINVSIKDRGSVCIVEKPKKGEQPWYVKCEDMLLLNIALQRVLGLDN